MNRIKKLENMLLQGKITRREFLARLSVLGASVAISPSLVPSLAKASEPKKGGRFRIGLNTGSTTDSLEPATLTTLWAWKMNWQIRNNLVEVDHTGNPIPELAESWEPSSDSKQWVFKLRKGVEFHNGKTLNVEDVIDSIQHHRGEASKSGGKVLVASVTDIKADGKNTVIFSLKEGNADFPFVLTEPYFSIFPAGTKKEDHRKGIGTGPYILENFKPGVMALAKRNPNYWKAGRAHFDEVETLNINDNNARTNALRTGRVDFMNQCELRTIHLLKNTPGIQIVRKPSGAHYTLPMHTGIPPFDNNDVRLALKYAIDRQQLVATVLRGYGTLGNDHPVSPTSRFHASELPQREYDPDKAKYHLKKAGLQDLTIKLHTSNLRDFADYSMLYKEQAAKAGINIEVTKEPEDGYWKNIWRKAPFCHCFWNPRPTEDIMFTTAYAADAAWNDAYWKHKRFNDLLKIARAELDKAKRREMYVEMQSILRDEGGSIVFLFTDFVAAASDKMKFENVAGNKPADGLRCAERWWFA